MAAITRRLADRPDATVMTGDSAGLLPSTPEHATCPLVYLDARWEQTWPLPQELHAIRTGIAVIDDFAIDHSRFRYDTYNGQPCDARLVIGARPDDENPYIGDLSGT
jgi:hypothetical protein